MKRFLFYTLLFTFLLPISCKKEVTIETERLVAKEFTAKDAENSVIYEANIRQYSPEGTFEAFTRDIPKLKELGVKILWVMPVQPISMVKRKATEELSIEDIEDSEEKKKYLGSYYAVADYTDINSEYGNLDDFKKLVETAHDNGIFVILDWVANHTGWDHIWIEEHPEFYHKNEAGEIIDPIDKEGNSFGWSDVAYLNYENPELQQEMINEMKFWIEETDIDGFRCDVANMVPLNFWRKAKSELEKEKSLFWLAETDEPEYFDSAFDMGYNWKVYHLMNEIAGGEKNANDLEEMLNLEAKTYPKNMIFMNFTSNHDENSWDNPEFERLGDAVETFAALTYFIPGMPLIYNGQEYDSKVKLKFFEKDEITKEQGKMFEVYKKLGALKNENPALNGGKDKAKSQRISTSNDENIFLLEKEKSGKSLYFIGNLTAQDVKFTSDLEGKFEDYMTEGNMNFSKTDSLKLKGWEYKILIPIE